MTQTEKQLTCEERIRGEWTKRRYDLYALYLTHSCGYVDEFVAAQGHDFREMSQDDKDEVMHEERCNYGLSFDYVEANTFDGQDEGYFRYQFSWGGPSDELRFFVDLDGTMRRAQYWFMDWYDGAHLYVTDDEIVQAIFDDFDSVGMIVVPEAE